MRRPVIQIVRYLPTGLATHAYENETPTYAASGADLSTTALNFALLAGAGDNGGLVLG